MAGRAVKRIETLSYALRSAVHELGRVGGLGVALLAGAGGFYAAAVLPAQQQALELQERRAALAARTAGAHGHRALDRRGDVDRFVARFPPLAKAPDALRRLYAIAGDERLALLQGRYRLSEDRVLGLARYGISLPVRGTYPQIRRFIGRTLDEIPEISLEQVVFQREQVGEGAVEAKIGFTLHLRSGSRASSGRRLALGGSR